MQWSKINFLLLVSSFKCLFTFTASLNQSQRIYLLGTCNYHDRVRRLSTYYSYTMFFMYPWSLVFVSSVSLRVFLCQSVSVRSLADAGRVAPTAAAAPATPVLLLPLRHR